MPENYACFSLRFENLNKITNRFGYTVGDGVLKDFSDLVGAIFADEEFVGYNGVGNYIAFAENCSDNKAQAVISVLTDKVDEYNEHNSDYPIDFNISYSVTSETGTYEIRDLLRLASKNNFTKNESKEEKVNEDD